MARAWPTSPDFENADTLLLDYDPQSFQKEIIYDDEENAMDVPDDKIRSEFDTVQTDGMLEIIEIDDNSEWTVLQTNENNLKETKASKIQATKFERAVESERGVMSGQSENTELALNPERAVNLKNLENLECLTSKLRNYFVSSLSSSPSSSSTVMTPPSTPPTPDIKDSNLPQLDNAQRALLYEPSAMVFIPSPGTYEENNEGVGEPSKLPISYYEATTPPHTTDEVSDLPLPPAIHDETSRCTSGLLEECRSDFPLLTKSITPQTLFLSSPPSKETHSNLLNNNNDFISHVPQEFRTTSIYNKLTPEKQKIINDLFRGRNNIINILNKYRFANANQPQNDSVNSLFKENNNNAKQLDTTGFGVKTVATNKKKKRVAFDDNASVRYYQILGDSDFNLQPSTSTQQDMEIDTTSSRENRVNSDLILQPGSLKPHYTVADSDGDSINDEKIKHGNSSKVIVSSEQNKIKFSSTHRADNVDDQSEQSESDDRRPSVTLKRSKRDNPTNPNAPPQKRTLYQSNISSFDVSDDATSIHEVVLPPQVNESLSKSKNKQNDSISILKLRKIITPLSRSNEVHSNTTEQNQALIPNITKSYHNNNMLIPCIIPNDLPNFSPLLPEPTDLGTVDNLIPPKLSNDANMANGFHPKQNSNNFYVNSLTYLKRINEELDAIPSSNDIMSIAGPSGCQRRSSISVVNTQSHATFSLASDMSIAGPSVEYCSNYLWNGVPVEYPLSRYLSGYQTMHITNSASSDLSKPPQLPIPPSFWKDPF